MSMETQRQMQASPKLTPEQHKYVCRLARLTIEFSRPGTRRMALVDYEEIEENFSKD